MTEFLTKLFIKNHNDTASIRVRQSYGKLVGVVGIVANLLLSLAKLLCGYFFHSVSLTADGANNLSDMGNSLVTYIGFHLAGKPADKDHPYGHARYEYITGLLVSFLILMLGLSLLKTAVEDIFFPKETIFHDVAIWIMVGAVLVKLWLYFFYRGIGKKLDSVAILANAKDSLNDVFSTSGVLLSFLLGKMFHLPLDGYVGALVSLLILYSGWELVRNTMSQLLGEAPKPELVNEIKTEILDFHESIIGIHDLMVHEYGAGQLFVSVHVEVPASQSILTSHDIVDQIEVHFMKEHGIQMVIHLDPVETDNPRVVELKAKISAVVTEISPKLHIHDFRVVFLASHNNLIFDVEVPFEFPYSEKKLEEIIKKEAGKENNCIIQFDKTY